MGNVWHVRQKLTAAGQAEIYRVTNAETGDEAVMKKVYPAPQLRDPDAEIRRFKREVRCQSGLRHKGIMPILGTNFETKPPWYIMPRAKRTLADLIAANPSGVDPEDAAEIMLMVADAVEFAHQNGVLHRDLKPENILQLDDRWVVGDFGLCRDLSSDSTTVTQSNTVVGTVAYMAPEQFDDAHEVGVEADVFALGRISHHLLTGRCPFPYARLDQVPASFKYLVVRATASEPQDRYSSVAEFSRELDLLTSRSDTLAPPTELGKTLLTDALENSESEALNNLLQLILENANDEVFFHEFVANLPQPVLAAIQLTSPDGFADIVKTFDEYSQGSHPFTHVDVIADFFANVFTISDSIDLRRIALRRIMIVGQQHNRFYVHSLVIRLISKISGPQDIMLVAGILKNEHAAAKWYKQGLESLSLPPALREILAEAS